MKQYIGSKIVQAEPAIRYLMKDGSNMVVAKNDQLAMEQVDMNEVVGYEEAYVVVYKDGYESWSPKDVFEKACRRTDGMSFGLALEAAKMGKCIARKGWNGKGQYVELGTDFAYHTLTGDGCLSFHQDIEGKALVFCGTRGRQVGWLASQSDMLADDWYIVE